MLLLDVSASAAGVATTPTAIDERKGSGPSVPAGESYFEAARRGIHDAVADLSDDAWVALVCVDTTSLAVWCSSAGPRGWAAVCRRDSTRTCRQQAARRRPATTNDATAPVSASGVAEVGVEDAVAFAPAPVAVAAGVHSATTHDPAVDRPLPTITDSTLIF